MQEPTASSTPSSAPGSPSVTGSSSTFPSSLSWSSCGRPVVGKGETAENAFDDAEEQEENVENNAEWTHGEGDVLVDSD